MMSVISRPDSRDWTALPPADLPWDDIGPSATDVGGPAGRTDARRRLRDAAWIPRSPRPWPTRPQAFAEAGAVVEPLAPFLTDELLGDLDTFWRVRSWNDFQALAARWPGPRAAVHPAVGGGGGRRVRSRGAGLLPEHHGHPAEVGRRHPAVRRRALPVAPVPAFPAEWPMPFGDRDRGMVHIGFTAPANLSGQPSISVNAGFTDDGRTIGLAVTGRRFDDIGVLRAAAWWESARPESARPDWPIRQRATARLGFRRARERPRDGDAPHDGRAGHRNRASLPVDEHWRRRGATVAAQIGVPDAVRGYRAAGHRLDSSTCKDATCSRCPKRFADDRLARDAHASGESRHDQRRDDVTIFDYDALQSARRLQENPTSVRRESSGC